MLVLTRKLQQQIKIGDQITVTILRVKGQTVRVGIEAPRDVRVVRGELPIKPNEAAVAAVETVETELVAVGEEEDATAAEDAVAPRVSATQLASASLPAAAAQPISAAQRLPQRRASNRYSVPPLRLAMTSVALAK